MIFTDSHFLKKQSGGVSTNVKNDGLDLGCLRLRLQVQHAPPHRLLCFSRKANTSNSELHADDVKFAEYGQMVLIQHFLHICRRFKKSAEETRECVGTERRKHRDKVVLVVRQNWPEPIVAVDLRAEKNWRRDLMKVEVKRAQVETAQPVGNR